MKHHFKSTTGLIRGYKCPNNGELDMLLAWHDANTVTTPDYPFGVYRINGRAYDARRVPEYILVDEFKKAIKRLSSSERELIMEVYAYPHEKRSEHGAFLIHSDSIVLPARVREILAEAVREACILSMDKAV